MCRQGASVIQKEVLDAVKDRSVRVYVVWVPILRSDRTTPEAETLALVPDKRATHFWDEKGTLPTLFKGTLDLPTGCVAWDVYLIYPPGAKWNKEPPTPVYWQ